MAIKNGEISSQHVDNLGKLACIIMLEEVKFRYILEGDWGQIQIDHWEGQTIPGSESLKIKLQVGMVL